MLFYSVSIIKIFYCFSNSGRITSLHLCLSTISNSFVFSLISAANGHQKSEEIPSHLYVFKVPKYLIESISNLFLCEEELFLADSYRLKPVLARASIRKGYSNDFVSSDEIFEIIIQHYHEINMTNYNGVISIEEIGELLEE